MRVGALLPYEQALATVSPLMLEAEDGGVITLDVRRWLAPIDAVDRSVLDLCRGPTLDVGCGPGRFVAALAERGAIVLGVDIAATAVELTRRRGVPALLRSVFTRVPGEGRWSTVLLMDGNIGIDGDPERLLDRLRSILAPSGQVIVECEPSEVDVTLSVRFSQNGDPVGPPFAWSRVGPTALRRYAHAAGYVESANWSSDGRVFVVLSRPNPT